MKGTECLENIFTDMNSVEHKRVFSTYVRGTQDNIYHSAIWEDKTPSQQIKGTDAREDGSDGRED